MPGREGGVFRRAWRPRQRRKYEPTAPSAYERVVRWTDNAALYARFDDRAPAGTVVRNMGWTGLDGERSGATVDQAGAILTDTPNRAFDFDGTDDYVYFYDDAAYSASGGSKVSIEIWLNPDSVTGDQTICSKSSAAGNNYEWEIRRTGAGVTFISHNASASSYSYVYISSGLTIGSWAHIVMELDTSFASNATGFIKGYINTVSSTTLATSGTQPFTPISGTSVVWVGATYAYLNGKLDELAIYDYVLGSTRVENHYAIAGYTAAPQTVVIEQAVETDTASAIDVDLTVPITQATETDTASALTVPLTVPITQATETDTASALGVPLTILIEQAVEVDTAGAFSVPLTVPITQAVETDTAETLVAMVPQIITIEQAVETDTAGGFTANMTFAIEQAVETDTAFGFTVPLLVPITQAAETDTAQALGVPLTVPITQASETDTAPDLPVKLTVPLGQAVETDTAEAFSVIETGPQTIAIEQAVETDSAADLGVSIIQVVSAGDRMEHERVSMHSQRHGTIMVSVQVGGHWRRRRNQQLDDEEVLSLL